MKLIILITYLKAYTVCKEITISKKKKKTWNNVIISIRRENFKSHYCVPPNGVPQEM